mgnify:CR=1 FL=1|jgi:hypothetical protein
MVFENVVVQFVFSDQRVGLDDPEDPLPIWHVTHIDGVPIRSSDARERDDQAPHTCVVPGDVLVAHASEGLRWWLRYLGEQGFRVTGTIQHTLPPNPAEENATGLVLLERTA